MSDKKVTELVAEFRALRDKKKQAEDTLSDALKPTVERMEQLKAFFKKYMQKQGIENISTADGTVYTSTKSSVTVRDKTAFFDWVQQDRWEYADIRASKANIITTLEADGSVPDGVNISQFIDVGFRKPTKTKGK